jgi:ribosomal protein L21
MSRKLIVLKKKRRKQYRRSIGFTTPLTILRITKIDFKLTDNLMGKAVALQ